MRNGLIGSFILVAAMFSAAPAPAGADPGSRLESILAAQPEETRARYAWRNPVETLAFFGIAPGMTVVEALPGGGWYSKILIPYLGSQGRLIGADYAAEMFPLFGFFSEEFIAKKDTWVADWTAEAEGWRGEDAAPVAAFQFGSMPEDFAGTADAALFIRALHNLARFESDGAYLTKALGDVMAALKPGGVLGVVQHRAPAASDDAWATGANGYLKQDWVIARLQQAGFEFLGASELNANPLDQPAGEDVVWRLPPTLSTSRDNPELRAQLQAIGESDRMTLKFRKPE